MFGHIGGPGLQKSWRLLRKGGTLVSYGTAATKDDEGASQLPMLKLVGQLKAWHVLPNGRNAYFYNFRAGQRRKAEFRSKLADDLTQVFHLLADGVLIPQVSADFSLAEAASALALAESGTVAGKVILVP